LGLGFKDVALPFLPATTTVCFSYHLVDLGCCVNAIIGLTIFTIITNAILALSLMNLEALGILCTSNRC
jgi:hypothetical protein